MDPVDSLVRRLAALWGEARSSSRTAQGEDRALAGLLRELDATHRQLAQLGTSMPHAASTGRQRRRHVEALQSAVLEVEAELERARTVSARLGALAARQLAAAREAQPASATLRVTRLDCFRPTGLALITAVFGAGFAAVIAPPVCTLVFSSLFPSGPSDAAIRFATWVFVFLMVTTGVFAFLVVQSSCTRFEFDGRWLRITSRFLGMTIEGRTVDLATLEADRGRG